MFDGALHLPAPVAPLRVGAGQVHRIHFESQVVRLNHHKRAASAGEPLVHARRQAGFIAGFGRTLAASLGERASLVHPLAGGSGGAFSIELPDLLAFLDLRTAPPAGKKSEDRGW